MMLDWAALLAALAPPAVGITVTAGPSEPVGSADWTIRVGTENAGVVFALPAALGAGSGTWMAAAGVGGVAALPAAAWLDAAWYNAGQVDDWAKVDMIRKSGTTVAHMCAAAVQLKLVHLSLQPHRCVYYG